MKKIIGTDDNSKVRRNIKNNVRIVKEFPWLWGVLNCWSYGHMVMRVSNEDLSPFFSDFVTKGVGMGDDRLNGMWIHTMGRFNGAPEESVRTVWDGKGGAGSICDNQDQMMWCTKLHSFIAVKPSRVEILHIAMMYWHGDAMVIYRPQSGPSFNRAICECMW